MKPLLRILVSSCLALSFVTAVHADFPSHASGLERVVQELVAPPALPIHKQVATGEPKVVQVRMVIEDKLIEIDSSGTKIWP
jgi:nitrite reductase (NO-forming)